MSPSLPTLVANALSNLATCLTSLHRTHAAEGYFDEALSILRKNAKQSMRSENLKLMAKVCSSYAELLLETGRIKWGEEEQAQRVGQRTQ